MSMFRDPNLVRSVILDQGLTKCVAYDIGRKDKLASADRESPAELVQYMDQLLIMIQGPFRFEAWRTGDKPDKGGVGTNRDPYVWLLMGESIKESPVAPAPAPAPHIEVPKEIDVMTAEEAIKLHVKVATLELTNMALERECARLRSELDDIEEMNTPDPMQPVIDMLMKRFMPSVPPAPASAPINGNAGMVSGDADFLSALDAMYQAHPDQVEAYRNQIIEAYGQKKQ
jgi:hypothetical protein